MTIVNKKDSGKLQIDLTGPAGNAFNLLGVAAKLCRRWGKDSEAVNERMTSGDYENLVAVFDSEFGEFVDLLR